MSELVDHLHDVIREVHEHPFVRGMHGSGANAAVGRLCWVALRTVRDRQMDKPESLEELFAGRHFNRDVIILCVRWYLRFKLSLRDLVDMMAERGLSLAHTTI